MTTPPLVKVGNICEQIRGVTYSKADAVKTPRDAYLPVLRANNITEFGLTADDLVYVPEGKVSGKQKVRENDIVIAASSGSLDVVGKAARALADFEGGFGAFCKVLRPSPAVDPGYFAQYFQTKEYRQKVSSLAAGANINNLRNEHLNDLEIPLPPLSEQRRIAAILDKADALRGKRRDAIAKCDQLLQSVFLEMFGDPVTNPKGWPEHSLGELVKFTGGSQPAKKHFTDTPGPGKTRLVQIRDFRTDKYPTYIPEELARRPFSKQDVMIGRYGPPVFQIFRGLEGTYNVALMKAEPKSLLDREFLFHLLRNDSIQRTVISNSQRSAGQSGVNLDFLHGLIVGTPPLELQRSFASFAAILRSQSNRLSEQRNQVDDLFLSLQQRAFSGQLTA